MEQEATTLKQGWCEAGCDTGGQTTGRRGVRHAPAWPRLVALPRLLLSAQLAAASQPPGLVQVADVEPAQPSPTSQQTSWKLVPPAATRATSSSSSSSPAPRPGGRC